MAISTSHKVYIPNNASDNQYILAEFPLSPDLFARYATTEQCYQQLSALFFRLTSAAGLQHCHFIANDKLPVVRFHTEAFNFQTAEQVLFFYNPAYHEAQTCWFDPQVQARKISLLCLATGDEIRNHAAEFHQRVRLVMQDFKQLLPVVVNDFRLRDHQHLSYDLFARAKGCDSSFGYKLRSLAARYQARALQIPADHKAMTYAAVSLPISRQLKTTLHAVVSEQDFSALYQQLEQTFIRCAASQNLTRLAFVADGTTALVRNSHTDKSRNSKELSLLSFDVTSPQPQVCSRWQAERLVDTIQLLLVAGQDDNTEFGYGKFMNQVEQSLRQLAQQLEIQPASQDLTIRFHQHISYLI